MKLLALVLLSATLLACEVDTTEFEKECAARKGRMVRTKQGLQCIQGRPPQG